MSALVPPACLRAFRPALAFATVACAVVAAMPGSASSASTSGSVVGATVPSATLLDLAGCASGVSDVTDFGAVTAGSGVVTGTDCDVVFGSSNDTASLRIRQGDEYGAAMGRVGWTAEAPGSAANFYAVEGYPGGIVWAVGTAGTIYRSTDAGANWSSQASGVGDNLSGIEAIDADSAWATGLSGSIIRTDDGGATWTPQPSGTATGVAEIAAADSMNAVAVGHGGLILRTTNGGTSWVPVASPLALNYMSIDYVDGVYWAGNAGPGGAARSIDGGATFVDVSVPGGSNAEEGMAAIDADSAYLFGRAGDAWRTDDGGSSWTPLTTGVAGDFWGAAAIGDQHVWAVTSAGDVIESSDGGTTFTTTWSTATTLDLVHAIDQNTVYVAGFSDTILRRPGDPIDDYQSGVADWDTGAATGFFGACLRDVSGGASTDVDTWSRDTVDQDCADGTSDPWRGIGAADSKVAESTTATTETATAHLRFGIKPRSTQPAGDYLAPVTFSVVAPNT